MRYFDLHCDTITECYNHDVPLKKNDLHVDLERAEAFETYAQCYAVWIPDSIHGEEAFQRFCQVAKRFSLEVERNAGGLKQCSQPGDLTGAQAAGKHCAVLTVENASALGGRLENIKELARLGVKLCTLTWNGENELGRGVRAPGNTGLTSFGKQAVSELERHGILIDLSHASPALFDDAAEIAQRPLVATHSNAQAVCGHPRNLTDRQFMAIRDSGGLVGLNFLSYFLNDDSTKACLEDVLRHAEHFLSLGGEDVLAMGADWDGGAPKDFPLSGIQGMGELYELFLRHGYSEELTDKIFYRNAAEFFERENML